MINSGGAHAVAMCISIICTYSAIRLHGVLSISLGWTGLNITMILATYVSTLGNINCSSKSSIRMARQRPVVLHKVGKDVEGKLLQREVRCLQEIRIRMCSVFFYDKTLVVTTFEIILKIVMNLLLLY